MKALKIDLHWYIDSKGYRLDRTGEHRTIVGNGGSLTPTRPLENDLVFSAFSSVETEGPLLDFVNNYGFLKRAAYGVWVETRGSKSKTYGEHSFRVDPDGNLAFVQSAPVEGEDVSEHLETARVFREILRQSNRGWTQVRYSLAKSITEKLSEVSLGEISLADDTSRGFRMVLTTDSLLNGMWLQLAQKVSDQAKFQQCRLCGVLFEVGPRAERRADATFCCDKHRIEFNSLARSRGS